MAIIQQKFLSLVLVTPRRCSTCTAVLHSHRCEDLPEIRLRDPLGVNMEEREGKKTVLQ